MSRLSYNGVFHAALCLAKDTDEKPLLVPKDVFELLVDSIFPFLLIEYLSVDELPSHSKPPRYDDRDKHTKMAVWTSTVRSGHANPKEDIALQEQAIKIVIGSGLWSVIHLLAMIVEKEPSNATARRTLNLVCRSTVQWIMCPMCSSHWGQALDDVDNATKESSVKFPPRSFERMSPSEVFDWTVKIHTTASGSERTTRSDPVMIRFAYLQRYKKLKRS